MPPSPFVLPPPPPVAKNHPPSFMPAHDMFDKMSQRYCPCSFDQRIAHVKMWLIYAIFYAFSLDNESFLDSMNVTSHEDFVGSEDAPSEGFVQPQLDEDE
jgi:hypothetical protein